MCIDLKISYSDYINHKEPEKYEVTCVRDYIVPRYDLAKAEIMDRKLFSKGSVCTVTKFYDNSFSIGGETIPSDVFSDYFKTREEIRDVLISEILK